LDLRYAGCDRAPSPTIATPAKAPDIQAARRTVIENFLVEWFKTHGPSDVIVDANGVGIAGNVTRPQAGLYDSKSHDERGFTVEVAFTILLPSGRKITEFVAGMGNTEAEAIQDAMVNFTLATFHVVYKGFINPEDPHLMLSTVAIKDQMRDVIAGDLMLLGAAPDQDIDLSRTRAEIQSTLQNIPLTPEPHWIKIVYAQNNRAPKIVAVTLDNSEVRI
jgi:Family of unknown function (DUF6348)